MKELSIEEKAKAYDNVREKIATRFGSNVAKEIFSEYELSEDERIRKELIAEVKEQIDCISAPDCRDKEDEKALKQLNKWLAWLEKQGETFTKKDVDDAYLKGISDAKRELEKQGEKKSADKVEPKFKVGDIIRLKDGDGLEWTVEEVLNNGYYTIACADRDDFILLDDNWELVEQKPDETEKGANGNEREIPNSAWSEEDEKMLNEVILGLNVLKHKDSGEEEKAAYQREIDWLESLKDRVLPQPKQKWSKEDEKMTKNLTSELYNLEARKLIDKETKDKYTKWLKSLRPQSTWKPSDEQMKLLREVQQALLGKDCHNRFVNFMYELKRLREE